MGALLPIEYDAMVTYAVANGLADTITELEEFVTLIQAQDRVFTEHHAKKAAPPSGSNR